MHVHGEKNLYIEKFVNYNVQALNWENVPYGVSEEEASSIAEVRSMTDKVIIGGTDLHQDYHSPNNDRAEIKEKLVKRLQQSLHEVKDNRFIFAPGCALPLDVDRDVFTLLREVVDEYGIIS